MRSTGMTELNSLAGEDVASIDRFLPLEDGNSGYGAAAYIGNRTLLCRLYDLGTGELVAATGASGDYVSFTGNEIKETLTDVFENLANTAGISLSKVNVAVVSGSAAIETKTAGVERDELVHDGTEGCDNFGCDVEYMLAGSNSIAVGQAFFVPCLGDEVGGDFLCSLLAIDMLGSQEPILFINGSIEGASRALVAYGNRDAISIGVLSEGADTETGLRSLLELCDAEYDRISKALVAGDISMTVPEELVEHLRRIEYPAIVGASAVLLSEDAEDELCNIVSGCRVMRI